jgi:putative ABC transport system substrate-binding protein
MPPRSGNWIVKLSLFRYCSFSLITALLVTTGSFVQAQTIGVIMTGDIPYYQAINEAMLKKLAPVIQEKGIEIVVQRPQPNPMSWTNAARKLKAIGSELIITYGMPATLTAMKEESKIPIVYGGVYSPKSLHISGKNATGISSTVSVRALLKNLRKLSEFSEVGIVFNKTEKDSILQAREVKKFEKGQNFKTTLLNISSNGYMEKMSSCKALILTACSAGMCEPHLPAVVQKANELKIPTAAMIEGAEDLVVLTISASSQEQGKHVADMAQKILGGVKPADIPPRDPEEIEIIINVKQAKSIGLDVPGELISKATRVIE